MKNEWMKYSSLAFQIVGTMIAGIAGGYYLDKYLNTSPVFLMSLLIIAVIAVLVIIIKTSSKP